MEFAQINRAMHTFGSVGNGVGTGDLTIMSNGMALGGYLAEVALMRLGIGIPIQEAITGYVVNGGNANYRFFTHSALIEHLNLSLLKYCETKNLSLHEAATQIRKEFTSLRLNPNH